MIAKTIGPPCKCGTVMLEIFRVEGTVDTIIFWCPDCGRVLESSDDGGGRYKPTSKWYESKRILV